jgi:hypothetical protein
MDDLVWVRQRLPDRLNLSLTWRCRHRRSTRRSGMLVKMLPVLMLPVWILAVWMLPVLVHAPVTKQA